MKRQLHKIAIDPVTGNIERGYVNIVEQDGQTFTTPIHRSVIHPGDPIDNDEDVLVKQLATTLHTPERVRAHKERVLPAAEA